MASTLSAIEQLVQELFDEVVGWMSLDSVSRLTRSSRCLHFRLQPVLLGTGERRSRAIKWACERGVNTGVYTALSYGAPLDAVTLPDPWRTGLVFTTSTVYLAVKHRRVDTFLLLLSLGASIDANVKPGTIRSLVDLLCHPQNRAEFLEPFLRAGLARQLNQGALDRMLMAVLTPRPDDPRPNDWPPIDVVRMVLDSGGNPNYVCNSIYAKTQRATLSPLSATLLAHRWDLFDLLLERGANIYGVRHHRQAFWPLFPLHVPMLAAAAAMHARKNGISAEPVEKCVAAGGDINISALSRRLGERLERIGVRLVTPLHAYIHAITTWDDGREIAGGLQYLLHKGVSIHPSDRLPTVYLAGFRDTKCGRMTATFSYDGVPPPATRILLDEWLIQNLTRPPFLETIQVLIQNGDLGTDGGRILGEYHTTNPDVISAWQGVLSSFIAATPTQDELNYQLFEYIATKGQHPNLSVQPDDPWQQHLQPEQPEIGELARATVLRFLEEGADINARPIILQESNQTALFKLCDLYANRGSFFSLYNTRRLVRHRAAFLYWLVETAGADPWIRCRYLGSRGFTTCTAAELLRAERQRMFPDELALADQIIVFFESRMPMSGWTPMSG